jgi:O-methyltransferase
MPNHVKRLLRSPFKWLKRTTRPSWAKTRDRLGEAEYEAVLKNAMCYASGCKVEGDYLEFGVSWGYTFIAAFQNAQRFNLKAMRFYAFDSFEGLPEIQGIDAQGDCEYHQGQYACNVPDFQRRISQEGVDLNRVKLVPGWYDKTLNEKTKRDLQIKKAAVVWVDCDLYESTVPVLDFITDYVQSGTIILFDDWYCFKADPNRGERRAFTEWLARNPTIRAFEYKKFEAAGNSFILNVAT